MVNKEIEIIYDRDSDVLAIIFDRGSKNVDFIEPYPGWYVWFDEKKNIRMVEILRASRFISKLKSVIRMGAEK